MDILRRLAKNVKNLFRFKVREVLALWKREEVVMMRGRQFLAENTISKEESVWFRGGWEGRAVQWALILNCSERNSGKKASDKLFRCCCLLLLSGDSHRCSCFLATVMWLFPGDSYVVVSWRLLWGCCLTTAMRLLPSDGYVGVSRYLATVMWLACCRSSLFDVYCTKIAVTLNVQSN